MNAVAATLLLFFTAAYAIDTLDNVSPFELPENSVMATMPKSELMEVLRCLVAESKERQLCRWYSKCLGLLPKGVMVPFSNCRRAITGHGWIPCEFPGPLWPTPIAGSQVFDCTSMTFNRKKTPEEKEAMYQFELCSRDLFRTGCAPRRRLH